MNKLWLTFYVQFFKTFFFTFCHMFLTLFWRKNYFWKVFYINFVRQRKPAGPAKPVTVAPITPQLFTGDTKPAPTPIRQHQQQTAPGIVVNMEYLKMSEFFPNVLFLSVCIHSCVHRSVCLICVINEPCSLKLNWLIHWLILQMSEKCHFLYNCIKKLFLISHT